jgi:hypothetical protein
MDVQRVIKEVTTNAKKVIVSEWSKKDVAIPTFNY